MSLLGVDIGSSRCKAVAFSAGGEVLAEASEGYAPEYPAPARVEMDPEALFAALVRAIRRAAEGAGPNRVEAIGLSSHGETFVAVDEGGGPLGPAILNSDNRATEEARWWEERVGRRRLFEITGLVAHPMYPLPKIEWLRRNEPELFEGAARFVSISEYVLGRLGLPPVIAYPLACRFMAFDLHELSWSAELLELAGLRAERLPSPAPAGTAAGRLGRAAARELGVEVGAPVVVGGHDQPNGALGMGAIRPGMVTDSLGTYECLVAVVEEPSLDERALAASLNSYCHVAPGQFITIAYFPSGIMVRWFCEQFCGAAGAAAGNDLYARLEAGAPEGPTGLCVLPHLIGSGNPHFDTRATGVIVGLTPSTDRYRLYKGILEGLACELAIITEALGRVVGDFDTIRCTGGGARSRLGLGLRATMTGRRMQRMRSGEAVCLGAALLAGLSAGVYSDLAEAVEAAVRVEETIAPDPEEAGAYARQVGQYRRLFPALAPVREAAG